jgi:hypothetical protein
MVSLLRARQSDLATRRSTKCTTAREPQATSIPSVHQLHAAISRGRRVYHQSQLRATHELLRQPDAGASWAEARFGATAIGTMAVAASASKRKLQMLQPLADSSSAGA